MFSQTLGTALGDWTADPGGLDYKGGALVFSSLLALVIAANYWTKVSKTFLFWAAFILTRPLGAVVGDFIDKPHSAGGLAMSRYSASAALLIFIIGCMAVAPQRASQGSSEISRAMHLFERRTDKPTATVVVKRDVTVPFKQGSVRRLPC
jgi:uncharacterized membrane-anchored protein